MRFNEIVVPYGTIRKLAKDTGLSEPYKARPKRHHELRQLLLDKEDCEGKV